MPRIDPLQLLKCLSVLLSPTGGIKSKDEVQRLASLMTKFSKKLVSKCIYIQILKTTKTDLLGMFMGAGGWNLTNTWLSDAIVAKNWPLIQELLELLLMCPVDVERLKANNCPKLIKTLSKDSTNESVKVLASKLVEQWLKIVKGETEAARAQHLQSTSVETTKVDTKVVAASTHVTPAPACGPLVEHVEVKQEPTDNGAVEEHKVKVEAPKETVTTTVKLENMEPKVEIQKLNLKSECEDSESLSSLDAPLGQLPVYKITIRDGKRVLAKVLSSEKSQGVDSSEVEKQIPNSVMKAEVPPVVKEEVKKEIEEVSTKVNSEIQKLPARVKVKLEKLDTSVESIKSVKDKKSKDSSSKSSDKDKKSKSESSKDKIRDKDRSKEKSRDRERDSKDRLKDKKSSSSNSDKLIGGISEKDKATLAKLIPPAISKLGKIPKKPRTDDTSKPATPPDAKKPSSSEVRKPAPPPEPTVSKKPSISIESRKLGDPSNRPKTVKTFNSKFRSTGLEEEAKPPPARPVKKPGTLMDKKPPPPPVKLPSLKRPSPPKELSTPPEKKMKPSVPDVAADDSKKNDKSGGIKLIPPRPKPSFLQESDMFMDALTASTKKEPRKRKRRTSSSKDGPDVKKDSTGAENNKDSTPPSSPQTNEDSKSPPIVRPLLKFYQDTMETNDDIKEDEESKDSEKVQENNESAESKPKSDEDLEKPPTPTEDEMEDGTSGTDAEGTEEAKRRPSKDESPKDAGSDDSKEKESTESTGGNRYPKGVLIYHKTRKGPKKVVRWKQEKDLETIKYFELDETERVNVTKTFLDMKQMEKINEREAFILSRKLPQDDIMEEKTTYQPLIPIDLPPSLVEPGCRSREKDVQYAREKVILQALYFSRTMIPDSAAEPDLEIHPITEPVPIPLEDVTGNPDSVNDFQNTPWPEPKPIIIPQSPPPQFQQPQPPFPQFPSPAGFQGPQMFPNQGNIPPNSLPMPPAPAAIMMNNMSPMGPINNMPPSAGGDWRTGDGKVLPVNDMPMPPMDMYGPGGPPMGPMGMPAMGGPGGPEMNYSMMPDDMGPFPPQGYPIGGPPPGMFPYRGGGGGGGSRGGDIRRGRGNQMGPRGPNNGPWYQNNGPHMGGGSWQGGGRGNSGSGGRGGRGWGNQNRSICKHFRGGFCRHGEKCPFLHPGVNGPQY